MQALVLEGQTRRIYGAGDPFAVLGQVCPVDQHRDRGAAAANLGRARGSASAGGALETPAASTSRPSSSGYRTSRVASPSSRPSAGASSPAAGAAASSRARRATRCRVCRRRNQPAASPRATATNARSCDRPQDDVDLIVREQAPRDRVHASEAGRCQGDTRRDLNGRGAATLGGRCAHERPDDQRDGSDDPDRLESEPQAGRTGDERRVAGEREQVGRAPRAPRCDGIERERRHDAEDDEVRHVGDGQYQPRGPT